MAQSRKRGAPGGWTEATKARLYPVEPVLSGFADIGVAAEALHESTRQIHRWIEAGGLSVAVADTIALELGLHPVDLWPTWYDDGLEDTEEMPDQLALDGMIEQDIA